MYLQYGLVPPTLGSVARPRSALGGALEYDDEERVQGKRCIGRRLPRHHVRCVVQLDRLCSVSTGTPLSPPTPLLPEHFCQKEEAYSLFCGSSDV
jgi:hypothetical protein